MFDDMGDLKEHREKWVSRNSFRFNPFWLSTGMNGSRISTWSGTVSQQSPTCCWRSAAWSSLAAPSVAGTWARRLAWGTFVTPRATTFWRYCTVPKYTERRSIKRVRGTDRLLAGAERSFFSVTNWPDHKSFMPFFLQLCAKSIELTFNEQYKFIILETILSMGVSILLSWRDKCNCKPTFTFNNFQWSKRVYSFTLELWGRNSKLLK